MHRLLQRRTAAPVAEIEAPASTPQESVSAITPPTNQPAPATKPQQPASPQPQDITQAPAFKAWFKQSEVVNTDGSPRVMYHATQTADIMEFKPFTHFGTQGAANDRHSDLTTFFEGIGNNARSHGANIMPVFLSIQNALRMPDLASLDQRGQPLKPKKASEDVEELDEEDDFDDDDEDDSDGDDEDQHPLGWEEEGSLATALRALDLISLDEFWECQYDDEQAKQFLEEQGYDGIVYENVVEDAGQDSWIVFYPSQIKSAIGNSGEFDAKQNSITAGRQAST